MRHLLPKNITATAAKSLTTLTSLTNDTTRSLQRKKPAHNFPEYRKNSDNESFRTKGSQGISIHKSNISTADKVNFTTGIAKNRQSALHSLSKKYLTSLKSNYSEIILSFGTDSISPLRNVDSRFAKTSTVKSIFPLASFDRSAVKPPKFFINERANEKQQIQKAIPNEEKKVIKNDTTKDEIFALLDSQATFISNETLLAVIDEIIENASFALLNKTIESSSAILSKNFEIDSLLFNTLANISQGNTKVNFADNCDYVDDKNKCIFSQKKDIFSLGRRHFGKDPLRPWRTLHTGNVLSSKRIMNNE